MRHHFFSLFLAFVLLVCNQQNAVAQDYFYNDQFYETPILYEFGGGIGTINCLTDLGGRKGIGKSFIKDINWQNSQVCTNIYAAISIENKFVIRIEGNFGQVKAYDSILAPYNINRQAMSRYYRNLSFRSKVYEGALVVELHPLLYLNLEHEPRLSPYLLAGVGRFSFEPEAYLNGRWIRLQPLRLEGQGFKEYPTQKNYSLKATSYPVGFGLRYEINAFFMARVEVSHRFTSTDYLDDASQKGYVDPSLFDAYLPAHQAIIAKQLYARNLGGDANYARQSGNWRGNPSNNDGFFICSVKLGLVLGRERR